MEMLREKIRGLEGKIIEMIRNSQENLAISDRLHHWTRSLFLTADAAALPQVLVDGLREQFVIPYGAIRVWGAARGHPGAAFATPVSDDLKVFARGLTLPYCGLNGGFEAASWFEGGAAAKSVAMIPLRHGSGDADGSDDGTFGLLALGSPDPTRYAADMGIDFLQRIGEIASASLSRLLREG